MFVGSLAYWSARFTFRAFRIKPILEQSVGPRIGALRKHQPFAVTAEELHPPILTMSESLPVTSALPGCGLLCHASTFSRVLPVSQG